LVKFSLRWLILAIAQGRQARKARMNRIKERSFMTREEKIIKTLISEIHFELENNIWDRPLYPHHSIIPPFH
jgi:hypothetical protein